MHRVLKQFSSLQLFVATGLLALFVSLFGASVAAAIARGYTTEDTELQVGMVVSLSAAGLDDQVERASRQETSRVVGVVVKAEDSLITVGSGDSQVLIETEGQVDVYVSDLGGAVNKGDLLVISPLRGVLMKGDSASSDKVIGIAASEPGQLSSYDYDDNGTTKQTQISKVKVDLNYLGVAANNGAIAEDSSLDKLGQALVGKDIGEIRILIALVIFVIVLIAEGAILYGAISSAVTALGRNPLAGGVIRSELFRVIVVACIVLFVGLGSIYAILWV